MGAVPKYPMKILGLSTLSSYDMYNAPVTAECCSKSQQPWNSCCGITVSMAPRRRWDAGAVPNTGG